MLGEEFGWWSQDEYAGSGRREPDHTAAHNLAKGVAALSIVLVDTPGKEY